MRIPIRTKLAAALAVPLVTLVGGAAFELVQAGEEADAASATAASVAAQADLATAAVGPGSLISNLQLERNITGVEQLGLQDSLELPVASSEEARAATDASVDDLREFIAGRGDEVAAAFEGSLAAIDDLAALRDQVDATSTTPGLANADFANEVFDGYSAVVGTLLDGASGIALGIDDAELRAGVEMVSLATESYEVRSTIVSQIILALLVNDASVGARAEVAGLVAESGRIDEALLARSTGRYAGLAEAAVLSDRVVGEDQLFDGFVADGTADLGALVAQVSSTGDNGYVLLRQQAADALGVTADGLQLRAQADRIDAEEHQQLLLAVAAAAVLLALVVSAFASRSITKPLRSLTDQARAMATDRLPAAVQQVLDTPLGEDVVVPELAPISVATRDEVADVAAVLTTVQGAALDLAVEQAVLRRNIADSFVNMSRRNQNLLDRQLGSISELEREEADPQRLEGLFRLDHLATRMRRNAESLLRLAGGRGAGESAGWSGPVSMVDVVRSALGEVEDYQRVDVRGLEPATANGTVGADLSHALAELIENALAFSPPVERVEVRGRRGDDGGYVLAIVDNGVGMTAEQLVVANRRLAGAESFTVAPSRYLGHYVAGHLASSHGIRVELQATPAGGVTARIDVPASVLVSAVPPPAPVPVAEAPAPAPAPPIAAPAAAAPAPSVAPVAPVAPVVAPVPAAGAPFEDLASWLVDAPADASSIVEPAPSAPAPAPAPAVPMPPAVADPVAGFGGLATRPATVAPADAATTASGLVKRVRGAQEPVVAPFTSPFAAGFGADAVAAGASSAADVGSFLSAFSGGVERGLADADAEGDPDPEAGHAPAAEPTTGASEGTGDWGTW